MSFDAKVLRVMIASPSDVQEERQAATEVLQEWNDENSFSRHIVLLPVKWETHTTPQFGAYAQVLVNKQILESSDILVGVFGIRIGTPTEEYPSGTVEEITRHAGNQKPVKLYFSDADLPRGYDREQYDSLVKYRTECQKLGLYSSFKDVQAFRRDFKRHLAIELNEPHYNSAVSRLSPITLAAPRKPHISEQAIEMLKKAVEGGGDLMVSDRIGINYIATGREQFGKGDNSPRTAALWKSALDELQTLGYVDYISGAIRRVTGKGYTFIDKLDSN